MKMRALLAGLAIAAVATTAVAQTLTCPGTWKFISFAAQTTPLPEGQGPFCTVEDCNRIRSEVLARTGTTAPAPTECWNGASQTFPTPTPSAT